MPIKYLQDYSISTASEVARLGSGIPHFADMQMRPYSMVNRYITDHYSRWSKNTSRTVAENLTSFLKWCEASDLKLNCVKLRHAEMYMNALADPGNASPVVLSTIVQRVTHACRFFDWAKRKHPDALLWDGDDSAEQGLVRSTRHYFTKKSADGITPRLIRQNTRFLHLSDAIKFIEGFRNASGADARELVQRNQLIAKVMLQCGLRVDEVVSLPVDWVLEVVVDDKRRMQLGRVMGKGSKLRRIEWPTKLLLEVQEYIDFQRQRIIENARLSLSDYVDSDAVFLSDVGHPITTNWVDKLFKRNSKLCGIHCTPHMLRHTYGTYHYLIHQDLAKLANLMGHSSEETTREYYVHTAALVSVAEIFNDFQKEIDAKLAISAE